MIQNTDPTLQQNYFSPTQIADTDAALANFRIDVSATTPTANAFWVGNNNVDIKRFDDLGFQTIDVNTTAASASIGPSSYLFAIDIYDDSDPTNWFNEALLAVNNSDTPQTFDLTVTDPHITRHAIIVGDFVGEGQTVPIPTNVALLNSNGEKIWSFGELIQHAEGDNTPLLVYTINNSQIRKSFVNFDFGGMNTKKINNNDK
jgi:hypothetical protein